MKFRKAVVVALIFCLLSSGTSSLAAGRLAPRDIYIRDEFGSPITGGSVTWAMKDRSARSAKAYGLTSAGLIRFPYAPAGEAEVKIKRGLLATGDYVSGSYDVTLGEENEITIAMAPERKHKALVLSPSGDGIAGAIVTLSADCQGQVWNDEINWVEGYFDDYGDWVDGYYEGGYVQGNSSATLIGTKSNLYGNYAAPEVTESKYSDTGQEEIYTAVTDSSGIATFYGYLYSSECTDVKVRYNDGIVIQNASGLLDSDDPIVLPYVPIVAIDADTVTTTEGVAVQIPVSVGFSRQENSRLHLKSSKITAAKGATVKIVLPKGASKGNCEIGRAHV